MQIFKMLINSLPYKFQNVVFIGDFPKSTIHAASAIEASNKVLCNLDSSLYAEGVTQQPFPVLDSLANLQTYQNANLKGFSSLKAPASIRQLLPGVIFDQVELKSQPLAQFIQNLNIPESSANLTILNLNGAEYEYLVESEVLLDTFNCVLISYANSNIFEGSAESYKKLLKHFEAQNITYSVFPAEVHPFSFILIHRMPNWKESASNIAVISKENEQLQSALSEAQKNINALSQKYSEAESSLADKAKELQAKAADICELIEKAKTHEAALNHEQENNQQLKNQINDQRSNIEKLTNEKQAYEASCNDIKAKYEKLEQSKQWVEDELCKAKAQLEDQNQSVKIANKLNLKLQIDLEDLRKRYSEKEQNERELSHLIDELYVKLKHASAFYYDLEKQYPELMDITRAK